MNVIFLFNSKQNKISLRKNSINNDYTLIIIIDTHKTYRKQASIDSTYISTHWSQFVSYLFSIGNNDFINFSIGCFGPYKVEMLVIGDI